MLNLADLPSPPPAELGSWLICVGGVLALYWLCRQIWLSHFPDKKDGERYVTHDQFEAFRSKMELGFSEFKADIVKRLDEASKQAHEQIRDLDKYTHEAFHRQADAMNGVVAGVALLKGLIARGLKIPLLNEEDG